MTCPSARTSKRPTASFGRARRRGPLWVLVAVCALPAPAECAERSAVPTTVFAPMSATQAEALTRKWLEEAAVADAQLEEAVSRLWEFDSDHPGLDERFDAVLQTFYMADPQVRELVDACLAEVPAIVPRQFAALESESHGEFYLHNLRYFYARFLA